MASTEMGVSRYKPQEWRFFIDSSERSLKCVLLHKRNKCASLPIGHSTKLKEDYNIRSVLQKRLSPMANLRRFENGKPQNGSQARDHWGEKVWHPRDSTKVGTAIVINETLISREKIIIPSQHGLMKQFVKALPITGEYFNYFCSFSCFNYRKAESRHF